MKICEDCFGKLWPGLLAQSQDQDNILHIQKREIKESVFGTSAGKCDYCGHERRVVFGIWYEG